jgi:hypothetical protein
MSSAPDLPPLSNVPDPYGGSEGPLPAPPALPPTPSLTREAHARRLLGAIVVALFLQALWCTLSHHRISPGTQPAGELAAALGVPALAAVLGAWMALGRGRRGLGMSTGWLVAAIVLPGAAFVAATLATATSSGSASTMDVLAGSVVCATAAFVLAGSALGLGVLVMRGGFATSSVRRTAALGVACGALAATTSNVACFHREALHVLVGHGWMVVAGGALGALLGKRITRS